MDLDKIRAMDYYDFQVHLRLAMVKENIEREFRMALEGIDPKAKKKAPKAEDFFRPKGGGAHKSQIRQRFDPALGKFVDS